jgi:phosphopantetheinyl transferase
MAMPMMISSNPPSLLESFELRAPITFQAFPGLTVHLLSLRVAEGRRGELLHRLSEAERQRAATFSHMGRRTAFIASRALLREAMSEATGGVVPAAAWSFEAGALGKPIVSGPAGLNLRFSLSYTETMVAIAVSQKFELGVDIETVASDSEVPWHVLTSAERRALHGLPPAERFLEFLRLWTIKEAYTKYLGTGASVDFRKVEVSLDAEAATAHAETAVRVPEPMVRQQVITLGTEQIVLSVAAARAETKTRRTGV